jgi:hypothetical protein
MDPSREPIPTQCKNRFTRASRRALAPRAAVQAAERRSRAARPGSRRLASAGSVRADTDRRQKLSPLIDRINDRYGRCSIGFGLFPRDVRAFKGHAAFHRVPEKWEF